MLDKKRAGVEGETWSREQISIVWRIPPAMTRSDWLNEPQESECEAEVLFIFATTETVNVWWVTND